MDGVNRSLGLTVSNQRTFERPSVNVELEGSTALHE
jgi:hypothetical protein